MRPSHSSMVPTGGCSGTSRIGQPGSDCKKASLSKSGLGGDRICDLSTYLDLGHMLWHFSTFPTTCHGKPRRLWLFWLFRCGLSHQRWHDPQTASPAFPSNNQRHQCSSNEKTDTEDLKEHERVPLSSWKFDNFLGSSATRLLGKQHWPFRRMIAHWFSHFEIQLDPLDTLYQHSSTPLIRSASTATSPVACLLQPTWNRQWRSTCGKNRPNRWPNQSKKMLHFVIARIQLQAVG